MVPLTVTFLILNDLSRCYLRRFNLLLTLFLFNQLFFYQFCEIFWFLLTRHEHSIEVIYWYFRSLHLIRWRRWELHSIKYNWILFREIVKIRKCAHAIYQLAQLNCTNKFYLVSLAILTDAVDSKSIGRNFFLNFK